VGRCQEWLLRAGLLLLLLVLLLTLLVGLNRYRCT
jgi:hypothetical protein